MANMNFGVNIIPKTNNTYSLGNSDYKWNIYANTINGTEVDELTLPPVTSDDNNKILKVSEGEWTVGTAPSSLDLGETSTTAYRGDRGAAAYAAAVTNVDSTPTSGSTHLLTSGGAYTALDDKAPKANPVFTGSISMGRSNNTTIGSESVAEGASVQAIGNQSHAEGYGTQAIGGQSHAEGYSTVASGNYTHAEGGYTTAASNYSHAEGSGTYAAGEASHAEGQKSTSSSTTTYNNTTYYYGATGTASHSEGDNTIASGNSSHAEGTSTKAIGAGSHAEGSSTAASSDQSHAEGANTTASGTQSHAEGASTTASGTQSHAEGTSTTASGSMSHAEGVATVASGSWSHSEGAQTTASNSCSHAEGSGDRSSAKTVNNTTYNGTGAHGTSSHSEGNATWAIGVNSHAEGGGATASGYCSHAEGGGTTASGSQSHAEGGSATASGGSSHAEGQGTTASGSQSHAEGGGTTASGANSHTEGGGTTASGSESHAEGASTTASGNQSHAEGTSTLAAGSSSHVSGTYNVADSYANWPEWVSGTSYEVGDKVKITTTSNNTTTIVGYICKTANTDTTFTSSKWKNQYGKMNYAEIVGNGTGTSARSNARALDWSGNEYLNGDLYVNCNDNSTGGSKVISSADVMTGATLSVNGTSGLVPAPTTTDINKFLRGDGTWASADTWGGITYSPYIYINTENYFIPARSEVNGTEVKSIWVSSTPGEHKVAKYDVNSFLYSTTPTTTDNSTKVATTAFVKSVLPGIMTGASASAAGTGGLVPAPSAGEEDKFLAGDGTYKSGGLPMVILSYGSSTWAQFEAAYNNNVIVYARASSNSNPATGSQTRMAFMAYVNNATTPTEVEFQYYRSMSAHSATAMGDQVFVYKLAKSGGWSVITRDASIKQIKVDTNDPGTVSWSGNIVTLKSGLPKVSSSDEGKILKVVNGVWTAVSPE